MKVLRMSYEMTEDKLRALFRLTPFVSPITESLPLPPPASILPTDNNLNSNNLTHHVHQSNFSDTKMATVGGSSSIKSTVVTNPMEVSNFDSSNNNADNNINVGKEPGITQSNQVKSIDESNSSNTAFRINSTGNSITNNVIKSKKLSPASKSNTNDGKSNANAAGNMNSNHIGDTLNVNHQSIDTNSNGSCVHSYMK